MENGKDHVGALVDAMIADKAMTDRASYLQRGRTYEHTLTTEVEAAWTNAFKAWFYHPNRPPEMQQPFLDAAVELSIRGLATPDDTIRTELDLGKAEMEQDGPDDPGVREVIRKFMASLTEPPN